MKIHKISLIFVAMLLALVIPCASLSACNANDGDGENKDDPGNSAADLNTDVSVSPDDIFTYLSGGSYPYFGGGDMVTAANGIFANFSGVEGTDTLVYRFGNEATYFEWIAEKIMPFSDAAYKNELKNKIINYPQTETGYLWSWTTSTWWPTGDGDMHYDGTFRYVSAVYDVIRYENSAEFLSSVCGIGETSGINGTNGKTVYEKCRLAMDYALDYLYDDGVIHLTADSMLLKDGVTRIDECKGEYLWDNTGRCGSKPSNYWDNLCFGGYDAYETALFYHALSDMACIEEMLGNAGQASYYLQIMQTVHQKFDEKFWDASKGRYIACIDEDGNRMDFGLTFLNTEALSYGLGDKEKAQTVFAWIDGDRIVKGDTVTGDDILNYSKIINKNVGLFSKVWDTYYLAPISNTVSIESYTDGSGKYWWYDLNGAITIADKKANASYGKHLENGGYIFYPVYYELTARAMYLGSQSVAERYSQIADVYAYNKLNSDVGDWVEGLCGEFPESGLTYLPLLASVMGIQAQCSTLTIAPSLPTKCDCLGVKDFTFGGGTYTVFVAQNGVAIQAQSGSLSLPLTVKVADATNYSVKLYDASGTLLSEEVVASAGGSFTATAIPAEAQTITVTAVASN